MKKILRILMAIIMCSLIFSENSKAEETSINTTSRVNIVNKINSVNKLFDVGEANLTDDDVIYLGGIPYYVCMLPDGYPRRALLITKYIYDQAYNDCGKANHDHKSKYDWYWTCNPTYYGTYPDSNQDDYMDSFLAYQLSLLDSEGYDYGSNTSNTNSSTSINTSSLFTTRYEAYEYGQTFGYQTTGYYYRIYAPIAKSMASTYSSKFKNGWSSSDTYLKNMDGSDSDTLADAFWSNSCGRSWGQYMGISYVGGFSDDCYYGETSFNGAYAITNGTNKSFRHGAQTFSSNETLVRPFENEPTVGTRPTVYINLTYLQNHPYYNNVTYNLKINWTSTSLTYSSSVTPVYVWDPEQTKYVLSSEIQDGDVTSESGEVSIEVINNSSTTVKYRIESSIKDGFEFEDDYSPSSKEEATLNSNSTSELFKNTLKLKNVTNTTINGSSVAATYKVIISKV